MIEEEDTTHPLTDEQITERLQGGGNRSDPPHRREIPRRHEDSVHASAAGSQLERTIGAKKPRAAPPIETPVAKAKAREVEKPRSRLPSSQKKANQEGFSSKSPAMASKPMTLDEAMLEMIERARITWSTATLQTDRVCTLMRRSDGHYRSDRKLVAKIADSDDSETIAPPSELVIITGFSGSGKGTVLKAFEDLGYYSPWTIFPST
jgi:hypothetical protein